MARVRSVLLVDFDNIFAATGQAFVDTLPKWLLWLSDGALSEGSVRRTFLAKRVYWNNQYDSLRPAFEAAGFEAFNCRAHAKSKIAAGKSSADIVMTMDAIELMHTQHRLDEIILLTTDSDFVPVVNRLQGASLRVVTGGKETDPTYELYSDHADAVIHIGALKAAFDYERAPRKWYKLQSPPPVIAPLRHVAERRSMLMGRVREAVRAEKANGTPLPQQQIALAADIVMQLGSKTPDQPLPRNKVIRALESIDGFQTRYRDRVKPWLGQRNFNALMRKISEHNPDIEIFPLADKSLKIVCRVRPRGPRARRGRVFGFADQAPQGEAQASAAETQVDARPAAD
ncbi:MAG: NYN domain-containing protein [Hyphomonas sp.]|uniref:NYN domain-containing protein n=1 Tax=Hyphomonas sp. TaxID=87 RepID=UPI0035282D47